MKILGQPVLFLISIMLLAVPAAAQNNAIPELGSIQGIVSRAGNAEPLSGAQVTLQGGAVDPQAMQILLNTAASQGLVVTPTPGATPAELLQSLSNVAVARGIPLTVANLQTQLASLSGKTPPTTTTDRDGRYSFKDVAPGSYAVRVVKDGFFGKAEGGIPQPSAAVDVIVAGKETKEGNVSMIPGAIIGGRVFDANGQLMSNATVQVLTVAYAFNHPLIAPMVSKVTDDRGEFRLFWVPPGDYYLAVTPRPPTPTPGVPAATSVAKTFYPGVPTVSEARMVSIRGGEDMNGMDIAIRPGKTYKVSGQVSSLIPPPPTQLGAPGVNGAALLLMNRDRNVPDDAATPPVGAVPLLPSVGNFEISNIPPGNYDLFARVADPAAQVAGGLPVAWGRVRLDVRDTDVNNVAIIVPPNVDVKGTVTAAGGAKLPASLRVQILPDDASVKIAAYRAIFNRSALVSPEGTFSVVAVPEGHYRVATLGGLPPDMYVADVRHNAGSVFDSGFDVNTKISGLVEIVLSGGAGTVTGVVQDGPTKVFPGATVVLVPEARRRDNQALYVAGTSDASGKFTLRGVAPGDYKVFAWESIPTFAYQNAAFIAKHEERGKLVHVGPAGTASAEVTVIPVVEKK
jgi:hypothetical protein